MLQDDVSLSRFRVQPEAVWGEKLVVTRHQSRMADSRSLNEEAIL